MIQKVTYLKLILGIPIQIIGRRNSGITTKQHIEVKTGRFKDVVRAAIDLSSRIDITEESN